MSTRVALQPRPAVIYFRRRTSHERSFVSHNIPFDHRGRTRVRPLHGTGIHRRVFEHCSPLLARHTAALPHVHGLSPARSTTAAPPHPRPWPASRPSTTPASWLDAGAVERPSVVPTFTAVRSTSEAPGSTPAASPWLRRRPSPWPPHPSEQYRARSSPPRTAGGCAPRTSPYPPGWSWRCFKRRKDTGSLRIPSRLAHRARPFRQYRTCLLYTSDAADEEDSVDLGGRRIIKKKKKKQK